MARVARAGRGSSVAAAALAALGLLLLRGSTVFLGSSKSPRQVFVARHAGRTVNPIDDVQYMQNPNFDTTRNEDHPELEALTRDVKVTDQRDLTELLKLPNPCRPSVEMQLIAITKNDGTRIDYPKTTDLKRLQVSQMNPVVFTWRDRSSVQTMAPKQYDDIISRLLNCGPAEMEDLVRSNWKMFDKAFFFRLTELKEDTNDERLKDKLSGLEKMAIGIVDAARQQTRKSAPESAQDAQDILSAMLEEDGDTLLWPPPKEAYKRMADTLTQRATRAKYADEWFENVMEVCERYGRRMQVEGKNNLFDMTSVVMQRLVTEWLRHDTLWEETDEGKFIYRLMSLSHEQWDAQLGYEQAPLDGAKLRDELKIISENKVVALPMGSKIQGYAAKYIHGLDEFCKAKDEKLASIRKTETAR